MLIIKIIAPVIVILITLIQFFIEHKYNDHRSKNYRRARLVFLIVVSASLVFTSLTIYFDNESANELNIKIENLQKFSILSDSLASMRENRAISERKNLVGQIEELNSELIPFIKLAAKKYPNLNPIDALNKLQDEMEDLRNKTDVLQERTNLIESRTKYKPLSPNLRSIIIDELKYIYRIFPDLIFTIEVESGNVNRQKIAENIKSILNEAGYKTVEINNITTFWGGVPPDLVLKFNDKDIQLANILFKPFTENYFTQRPAGEPNKKYVKHNFTIHLVGNPIIDNDGKITF